MKEKSEIYKYVIFIDNVAGDKLADAEIRASEDELKGRIREAARSNDKSSMECLVNQLTATHRTIGHIDRALWGKNEKRVN